MDTWCRLKKSLEPTPVGHFSSAFAVDITGPAWLSSRRQMSAHHAMNSYQKMTYHALDNLIASNQGNALAAHEFNRRLLSGDATFIALKSAVDDLVSCAPQDHDVVIFVDNISVHKVRFIEPHTFVFEGFNQDGHSAGVVLHFTQVIVHVVHVPKVGPSRVITGFAKPEG